MKRTQRHRFDRLLLAGIALLALAAAGPAGAAVLINEVLADPATDWDGDGAVDYQDDEWIEIVNTGAESVDLADYWLRDGLGDSPHLHLDGTLPAGAVLVVFGSDAVAWQTANGVSVTGFSLNNSGDTVDLLRSVWVDGDLESLEVAHSITYGDHEADDDRSCGWAAESGGWTLFDALNPYNGDLWPGGSGCAPTPGAGNLCSPQVGLESLSLDALKAAFR